MAARAIAGAVVALLAAGCATASADLGSASQEDCAVMMLAAGFIAEHQPPLRLRPRTADLRLALAEPERWSPDAGVGQIAALGAARAARRRPPLKIACPLAGPSPFRPWRPGRAELLLSNPALSPDGRFAVIDAEVLLPGRRIDRYRLMLSRPAEGSWDIHRLEFGSAPF